MSREHREKVEQAYAQWAASYDRLMRRTYQRVERAISKAHLLDRLPLSPDALLLDAGGGDAIRAVELLKANRAGAAVVLDLSADMLRLARKRVGWTGAAIELLRGDLTALPFPDEAFDLTISLGGAISHCREFRGAIAELSRVTRPGGAVVVSVDSRAVAVRTATRARDPKLLRGVLEDGCARLFHHRSFPFRVHFFTPDEFREELRAAGLKVFSLIGKPVFTHYLKPGEVLSGGEVQERVELAMPFVADPVFLPYADQLEAVCCRGDSAATGETRLLQG